MGTGIQALSAPLRRFPQSGGKYWKIYHFQGNVGPFCQVRLFIYGKRRGKVLSCHGENSGWLGILLKYRCSWFLSVGWCPFSYRAAWLSSMNHFVRGGIENMSGDRHSAEVVLKAGWTMGLRDNHELWDTDFFFFFKEHVEGLPW